ncbi:MAG TPA: MgtC/SapB family protein [Candidatus Angelobacter sp.]|nr:MgtC/SapB family protein [Candidatus Angelobacter sp.]
MSRLLLAAVLGGLVGLERQIKRRPAGLRTNMFICFGAAMFTILSEELAGNFGGDHTRIAAQIIPGIGFIGAGAILHERGGVVGLTTAATLFVVASIGMACGGGLYLEACFASALIVLALLILGWLETKFNLRALLMNYAVVTESSSEEAMEELNSILDDQGKQMQRLRLSRGNGKRKIFFTVEGTHSEHEQLMGRLRQSPELNGFEATPDRQNE